MGKTGQDEKEGQKKKKKKKRSAPGPSSAPHQKMARSCLRRSTDARLELLKKLLKKEKKKKRQKKLDKDKKKSKFDEAQRGRSPARRCGNCALPPPLSCVSTFRGATAPSASRHRRAE